MSDDLIQRRNRLLAEGNSLVPLARKHRAEGDRDAANAAWRRWTTVRARYVGLLPEVTVARCPDSDSDSDQIVRWAIDVWGLDGWFWEYDRPARRVPDLPPSWLTMTGALRLAGPVADAPFTARPGPEVPYVLPRLLDQPGVRAVLAQVPVGPHTGWTVTYFGPRPSVSLANVWGANTYPARGVNGVWGWDAHEPLLSQRDFDLGPWLRAGRLLWIAPGDDTARLRADPDGCPYTGLEGDRAPAFVAHGAVRRPHATTPNTA